MIHFGKDSKSNAITICPILNLHSDRERVQRGEQQPPLEWKTFFCMQVPQGYVCLAILQLKTCGQNSMLPQGHFGLTVID